MANHDNYEMDILKQLKRIAKALEGIEKKMPVYQEFDTTEYGMKHPEVAEGIQKVLVEKAKSCSFCRHSMEDGARTCNDCSTDHDKWEKI